MQEITQSQYNRIIFTLPTPEKVGANVERIVDGVNVKFHSGDGKTWNIVDTKIAIPPYNNQLTLYCMHKCQKQTPHKINKDATRVKCTVCESITDIRL